MRPQPQPLQNSKTSTLRTSLRSGNTMGIGEGARPRQGQNAAQPHQGLPIVSFSFSLLLGLRFLEALSSSRPAELTMQRPGKQKSYDEYPGGLHYEHYTCFIHHSAAYPLEGDMFNSPIPCLSHHLYRSAFTTVFS